MRDMIRLFVVVVVFSVVAGGLLAALKSATTARIEYNELKFVKGPTLKLILEGCSNDPLNDRFQLMDGDQKRDFFIGEFDGRRDIVAFESFGKGYGGEIGVMVAVNLKDDKIVGLGVTTHSETPGVGSRAKTDPAFSEQFKGLSLKGPFKVTTDGGKIDAVSGATLTSRGVCGAVMELAELYSRLKSTILEKMKT
jgi:electron transport complex protein RnfG